MKYTLRTTIMKIITWNCQGAFRKKAEFILPHHPDILIIPESEHPDKLKFKADLPLPTDSIWFGNNPNKGLGVFSYSDFRFKLLDLHNPDFKNVLPIAVTGGKIDFTLFAIWANNPKDTDGSYITQVWKAIHYYDSLLKDQPTILIGDFNSNTIWDKSYREGNHSSLVEKLEQKEIFSTYHFHYKQTQGREEHPTFFLQRKSFKPYHIDYCFASIDLIDKLEKVEIGTYENWITHSDHTPVTTNFKL